MCLLFQKTVSLSPERLVFGAGRLAAAIKFIRRPDYAMPGFGQEIQKVCCFDISIQPLSFSCVFFSYLDVVQKIKFTKNFC